MATIKSHSDVEQSKILSKILPIESADMALCSKIQPLMTDYISAKKKFSNAGEIPIDPCWSLAALLEHLRKIDLFPDIIDSVDCVLMDISFADNEDGKVLHPVHCIRVEGKTILDACVAMIEKLHEQKLL